MLPDVFYAMSWKDYCRAAEGYWLRHTRYMQGIRRLSYYIVRMNCDPKHAHKVKEEKLFRLATDPVTKVMKPVKLSQPDFQSLSNRYLDRFNKMKKNG